MSTGMQVDVRSLDWEGGDPGNRHGTIQMQIGSLADYKAIIARLHPGMLMFDNRGQGQRMRLQSAQEQESMVFPAEVTLPVFEEPLRQDDPRERMLFGNNLLQAGGWVDVIEFRPPSPQGQEGLLVALCDSQASYIELRRFLDEPHGKLPVFPRRSGPVVRQPSLRRWQFRRAVSAGCTYKHPLVVSGLVSSQSPS